MPVASVACYRLAVLLGSLGAMPPPPREASQIDDPPKDRWRNVMFPLDI